MSSFGVRDRHVDGAPGAAMVGYEADELGDSLGKALLDVLPAPRLESRAPGRGGRAAGRGCCAASPTSPPGHWIVENVGTRPELRRRGLVGALLERALARGRERGFARAQISCLIGNDAAQRAYEKAGFRVVEELRDAAFEAMLGAPGYSRMTLALKE